jgi:hypothetical protein
METTSICVNCQHQNKHEVDNNGQAKVTCESCSTKYSVQVYQVRAKGGRRDPRSGIKHYSIRVKEPDRDETMLEFDSDKEIEMRSGDWITGSYFDGKLKYLINQKIQKAWDVQPPPPPPSKKLGCLGCIIPTIIGVAAISVSFTLILLYII